MLAQAVKRAQRTSCFVTEIAEEKGNSGYTMREDAGRRAGNVQLFYANQ